MNTHKHTCAHEHTSTCVHRNMMLISNSVISYIFWCLTLKVLGEKELLLRTVTLKSFSFMLPFNYIVTLIGIFIIWRVCWVHWNTLRITSSNSIFGESSRVFDLCTKWASTYWVIQQPLLDLVPGRLACTVPLTWCGACRICVRLVAFQQVDLFLFPPSFCFVGRSYVFEACRLSLFLQLHFWNCWLIALAFKSGEPPAFRTRTDDFYPFRDLAVAHTVACRVC